MLRSLIGDGKLSRICSTEGYVICIHHIHKWPPCNFEKFKVSATKERIA